MVFHTVTGHSNFISNIYVYRENWLIHNIQVPSSTVDILNIQTNAWTNIVDPDQTYSKSHLIRVGAI